jgi:HJR/Mrr/RecB family endonuclease
VSKLEDFLERSILAFVSRISGPTVVALALLLYAVGGLVLPLTLAWSTAHLVEANVLGTTLAAVVSVGWLMVRIVAGNRRHLVEWTTDLRLLDSSEFEWLVGEVFRRERWTVRETGRPDEPDGNIDLELTRDRQRKIVQCKRWESRPVGVDEIRLFLGTLMREKLPGDAGIFVTLSIFTKQAREEAQQAGITLVDNRELYSRIEKARRAEPCPLCQSPMILDRSLRGWWLRCVTGGCSGKRDLSSDPGRAFDLLMEPH